MSATEVNERQSVDAVDAADAADAADAVDASAATEADQAGAHATPEAVRPTSTAPGASKSRGRRNLALGLVLAAFVALVYLITIARIGGASSGAG